MKFFWFLVLITIITSLFYRIEFVLIIVVIDFMVLWAYTELEHNNKDKERSNLLIKIENLERLMSDLFEKLTNRVSNKKIDKDELIEWLNKF